MVGAIADWFAVVALFRHPLGLPIPHTAIIPSNKDRIGARLAGFICNNFLSTPQVLAKLEQLDPAARLAHWLAQPAHAATLGGHLVAAARYGLAAFDDARVRDFLGRVAAAGLAQLDMARLAGQALDALTADGRHQALLDDVLAQVAGCGRGRGGAGADHRGDRARDPGAALRRPGPGHGPAGHAQDRGRRRAHAWPRWRAIPRIRCGSASTRSCRSSSHKLKTDPEFQRRGEAIRAELQAHPAHRRLPARAVERAAGLAA